MNYERQDFIHYMPRRVVIKFPTYARDPWFSHFQRSGDRIDRPARHTTRQQNGAVALVMPHDRIWIVSQIFSPWGALPPGVDACVVVERVKSKRGGGFDFAAAPSSRWFPLMDSGGLLADLSTLNASGNRAKLWVNCDRPIGHSLQMMRRLHPDSVGALRNWENSQERLPLTFVSYRITDGTRMAFEKVRQLLSCGEKVFWDRWCLPRRLAERRERISNRRLDAHVAYYLRASAVVLGIESPLYSDAASYAQKESALALELGTYKPVRPP